MSLIDLPPEFDAIGHAVLMVQAAGYEGIMHPCMKVVIGNEIKQQWKLSQDRYRSESDYLEENVRPIWEQRFGPLHADTSLEGCWAQYFKANGITYDGPAPLTQTEQNIVNIAGACDVPIGLVWAMIEGLGWRPGMTEIGLGSPTPDDTRALYEWWDQGDDPEFATTQALWMATYSFDRSNEETDKLIESLLKSAGIELSLGMVQTHHVCHHR